jgi:hypothetical protein
MSEADDPIGEDLLVLYDLAYGQERSHIGLRLGTSLAKRDREVRVLLLAAAVTCALSMPRSRMEPWSNSAAPTWMPVLSTRTNSSKAHAAQPSRS